MKETSEYNYLQTAKLLKPYFEHDILLYVLQLLKENNVSFKLSRPRKTKLGDFRVNYKTDYCAISVNRDLSNEQFLITTIHELAHAVNWKRNGRFVKPHGKEWKSIYKELFLPVINLISDNSIKEDLHLHIQNPKASSVTNILLGPIQPEGVVLVKDVPFEKKFGLGDKVFVKTKKLRTRFLCEDVKTRRKYYVHGLARITKVF